MHNNGGHASLLAQPLLAPATTKSAVVSAADAGDFMPSSHFAGVWAGSIKVWVELVGNMSKWRSMQKWATFCRPPTLRVCGLD